MRERGRREVVVAWRADEAARGDVAPRENDWDRACLAAPHAVGTRIAAVVGRNHHKPVFVLERRAAPDCRERRGDVRVASVQRMQVVLAERIEACGVAAVVWQVDEVLDRVRRFGGGKYLGDGLSVVRVGVVDELYVLRAGILLALAPREDEESFRALYLLGHAHEPSGPMGVVAVLCLAVAEDARLGGVDAGGYGRVVRGAGRARVGHVLPEERPRARVAGRPCAVTHALHCRHACRVDGVGARAVQHHEQRFGLAGAATSCGRVRASRGAKQDERACGDGRDSECD